MGGGVGQALAHQRLPVARAIAEPTHHFVVATTDQPECVDLGFAPELLSEGCEIAFRVVRCGRDSEIRISIPRSLHFTPY